MDLQKIAKILYNLSLDMDYADSLEYKDEEVKCITEELEILKQNECFSTLQMLEMIALKNEDMEHWKEGNSMSLREYLKELKIDQIEDDTEFCDKEYNAIMDYCTERKFLITDDDLACIVDRGMNDSYEYRRAQYIKDLWLDFGNVPMNPNTECIEEEWNGFAAGWHRTSICDWFEESYGVSVVKDLMGL